MALVVHSSEEVEKREREVWDKEMEQRGDKREETKKEWATREKEWKEYKNE